MTPRTSALTLLTLGCAAGSSTGGSTGDAPPPATFSSAVRVGVGEPLDLAASADGALLVVGTTRGVSLYSADGALRFTVEHPARVGSVSISSSGARIAAADQDGGVMVLDDSGARLWSAEGLGRSNVVALSPDGAQLAVGGRDGMLRVLDATSGDEQARVEGFTSELRALAWRPDGGAVAGVDWDGGLQIWSRDGVSRLTGAPSPAYELVWSPDGQRLAVAGRPVVVLDVGSGEEVARFMPSGGEVQGLAFSPDSKRLAFGLLHGKVVTWAPGEDTPTAVGRAPTNSEAALVWTDPDTIWATADAITRFSVSQQRAVGGLPVVSAVTTVSLRGDELVLGGDHALLRRSLSGQVAPTVVLPKTGGITVLGWTPEGALVTAEAAGVRVQPDGAPVGPTSRGGVGAAALRPDGRAVAQARVTAEGVGVVSVVSLVSLEDGRTLWERPPTTTAADQLSFCADGALLLAQHERVVTVMDARTGEPISEHEGVSTEEDVGMSCSPLGDRVASAKADGKVTIWNPHTGGARSLLEFGGRDVSKLAWRPDGAVLAVAVRGGARDAVLLTDMGWGWRSPRELPGLTAAAIVYDVRFSPDGSLLAASISAGLNGGRLIVWDAAGAIVHDSTTTDSSLLGLAWSADGEVLVGALLDGTAVVVRVQRGGK
jgi:WD40 repeat protein